MASTEEEINSLIRTKSYASKDEVISDALRALLALKPGLKTEIAVDLYKTGKVSLWRGADIAGVSLEDFKELLATRSIKIEVGGTAEESVERLRKASTKGEKARILLKEEKMKVLDKYVGIIKLKKPITLEEILELEEDTWLY
jgi:predicted HTH domain antitoxin